MTDEGGVDVAAVAAVADGSDETSPQVSAACGSTLHSTSEATPEPEPAPNAATADGRPLVVLSAVARSFGQGATMVVAVDGVDGEVRAGQQIALTGSSGSGKSTLLHLMAGLDKPTRGKVSWPALGEKADHLRPGPVAVIFQGPSLLAPLDVVENVALPLILAGANPAEARRDALVALGQLGLEELAARLPEELSGGQAQRVAVARALAGKPRLILADEPTGQLDHVNGTVVVDALLAAATALGAALVLTTHDLTVAERLPEQWQMADGRLSSHEVASSSA